MPSLPCGPAPAAPSPSPVPASSPRQRASQATALAGLQRTQFSSCRPASPIGPGWRIRPNLGRAHGPSAETSDLPSLVLPGDAVWSLDQGSCSGSRACKLCVWPCSSQARLCSFLWVGSGTCPCPPGKGHRSYRCAPHQVPGGVWIRIMGQPGLGSVVGIPASAHRYRLPGPYPSQNRDWEGVSSLT